MKQTIFIYLVGLISGFLLCYLFLAPEPIVIETEPIVIEYEKPVPFKVDVPVLHLIPYPYLVTFYDSIPVEKIDTVYIIQDYFTAKHYADTLYNEKDAFIFLSETTYKNEIINRKLTFHNLRPDINFWAIGGDLSTQSISAGVMRRQGQNVVKLNVGYQNKPFIGIGYYRVL